MSDTAKVLLRPAAGSDAAAIAKIMRAALGSLDWMPVIHTPAEDLAFIRDIKQFQEKCDAVFRPELRKNKEIERFGVSVKR